ncbi:hypothetical protein KGM_210134 [Danaus plexippus plexippus]|uniref:Uncharacterized protein n=1 Tax=Danaus plexippus plexippus TaxID=278856 RepID=A0A212EH22_DANPL|nr:hypothetical protein KGM_210134 [Danaus plexippus plexippus]
MSSDRGPEREQPAGCYRTSDPKGRRNIITPRPPLAAIDTLREDALGTVAERLQLEPYTPTDLGPERSLCEARGRTLHISSSIKRTKTSGDEAATPRADRRPCDLRRRVLSQTYHIR